MKTVISAFLLLLMVSIPGRSQNKTIEDIFARFNGKTGITTVNVDKSMMDLFAKSDSMKVETKQLLSQISNIKILVFEKAAAEDIAAFQEMVKTLPVSDYKELMTVKDKDQSVKMLMKQNGDRISEFLLLVTGGPEPVMISINGNLDPKEIGKLGGVMNMPGFQNMAKMNQKQ